MFRAEIKCILAVILFVSCQGNSIHRNIVGVWRMENGEATIVIGDATIVINDTTKANYAINDSMLRLSNTWLDDVEYPWYIGVESVTESRLVLHDKLWNERYVLLK